MGRGENDRDEQALFQRDVFPFLFALYIYICIKLTYLAAVGLAAAGGI